MTPSVFPANSTPAKADFPFSTCDATSPVSEEAHMMPPAISREASASAHTVNSFTPFAFAPGVLKTTMPSSAHFSTGMLFTPAPARAMASTHGGNSVSCMAAERTIIASALSSGRSAPTSYSARSKMSVPTAAILFISFIFFITILSCQFFGFSAANFFINSTSAARPS